MIKSTNQFVPSSPTLSFGLLMEIVGGEADAAGIGVVSARTNEVDAMFDKRPVVFAGTPPIITFGAAEFITYTMSSLLPDPNIEPARNANDAAVILVPDAPVTAFNSIRPAKLVVGPE